MRTTLHAVTKAPIAKVASKLDRDDQSRSLAETCHIEEIAIHTLTCEGLIL